MSRGRKAALYGILTALALVLSYLESLIPMGWAVPGMKLGLTNIVVVFALYRIDIKCALTVNLIRIILAAFLFGSLMSFLYSLAGGALSCLVMILLKKTGKLSIVTVSAVGGVAHNVAQLLVAMFVLGTVQLAWYLLILWFTGIAAGIIIGIISAVLVKKVKINGWI